MTKESGSNAKKSVKVEEDYSKATTTFIVDAPTMSIPEEVAEYLKGGFADLLFAAADVLYAGVACPPELLHDLGLIAEGMAETLQNSTRAVFDSESFESVGPIATAFTGLWSKVQENGVSYQCPNGRVGELHPRSLPALANLLECATSFAGREAEARWNEEMSEREAGLRVITAE